MFSGSSSYVKDSGAVKRPYPVRKPIPPRSSKNPGPGVRSAGDLMERESVIKAAFRRSFNEDSSQNEIMEPSKSGLDPENMEKDSIIKRLLSREGSAGSDVNSIDVGENAFKIPAAGAESMPILSEEERQWNNHQTLKALESFVPLKKRKLPFSAELSALPLPHQDQQIDNNMPVLEPEPMNVEIVNEDDNRPLPQIESILVQALASPPLTNPPPLTMKTKDGVTLHAYVEGRESKLQYMNRIGNYSQAASYN